MSSRRPSPHGTPFIPPLASPSGSPQPPVIPQLASSSSSGSNQGLPPGFLPTTPSTPWPASAYPPSQGGFGPAQPPVFPHNNSPAYPAFGGYPAMTPGMQSAQMGAPSPFMNMNYHSPNVAGFIPPSMFTPHTPGQPTQLPGGFQPHGGGIHPSGMSYDYIGYPPFGMTPATSSGAVPLSAPPNPANAAAAMQHAQAQVFAARAAAAQSFPTGFGGGGGQMSAPPIPPQNWGVPAAPPSWGFATPASAMHQPLGGQWSGGGAMDALAGGMGGMSMGMGPGMGGMGMGPGMGMGMGIGMGAGGGGIAARRPAADVVDRIGEFVPGEHYHPVLTPFYIKIIGAKMKVNPILQAPAASSSGHLNWNVLFSSSTIHFSKDPSHKSWSSGRDDPATFPRTTQVRILTVVDTFPWWFTVDAKNVKVGVTCGEIIEEIYKELRKMTSKGDWSAVPRDLQTAVAGAYRFNRGRDASVPGGRLGDGMRKLDYLRQFVWWGGIEVVDPDDSDEEYKDILRKWLNQRGPHVVGMPCLLLLRLESMTTRNSDEVRDYERSGRQRRASASGRPRSSSRAPSAHGNGPWGTRSRANSRAGSRPGSSVGVRVQQPSDSEESDGSSE